MIVDPKIKDGIYDNSRVLARQKWVNGALTGHINSAMVVNKYKQGYPLLNWGEYPDVPYVGTKSSGG